jgi:phage/plasmid-like protein (TIGR03299 family)
MAHEIQKHDQLMLDANQGPAWHSLGILVKGGDTPLKALERIGADNPTYGRKLYFRDNFGVEHLVPTHVVNVREIQGEDPIQHGVVSDSYKIIQNVEVAEFCEALAGEGSGKVMCETVGTIRNGAIIWFLLKGEQFEVARGDKMFPYILVSNGHDGGTTFRITPTTVRVVCSNTMHMVIPFVDKGELGESAMTLRHTVNIHERIEEARLALKHFAVVQEENRKLAELLANKEVNTEQFQAFFAECYQLNFGEIPLNPTTKVEENRANRAKSAYNSFSRRFDDELAIAGPTWWNTFNAFSGLVQHDLKARGKDDTDRLNKRVESNLFGLAQWRTQEALKTAFKAALSA